MENYLNISVILPIKNNKEKDFVEFFGKSIESLQIQEVQPKELVIVHTGDETLVEFLNSKDVNEKDRGKILSCAYSQFRKSKKANAKKTSEDN